MGYSPRNVIVIGNNAGISRVFVNHVAKKYDLLYSQRAFVRWYVWEGMEEAEFEDAIEDIDLLELDYLDVLTDPYEETDDDFDDNDDDST